MEIADVVSGEMKFMSEIPPWIDLVASEIQDFIKSQKIDLGQLSWLNLPSQSPQPRKELSQINCTCCNIIILLVLPFHHVVLPRWPP